MFGIDVVGEPTQVTPIDCFMVGGCAKGVDLPSEGPSKLIAVDEQSNHQIVHGSVVEKQSVRSPARVRALVFEFLDDRGGTDLQHACGVTNPTRIHRHLDDLLLDLRRLTGIA